MIPSSIDTTCVSLTLNRTLPVGLMRVDCVDYGSQRCPSRIAVALASRFGTEIILYSMSFLARSVAAVATLSIAGRILLPRIRTLLIPAAALAARPLTNVRFRSWPITEAASLEPELRQMGLRVPASEIDGTAPGGKGNCLSDALVSVGICEAPREFRTQLEARFEVEAQMLGSSAGLVRASISAPGTE